MRHSAIPVLASFLSVLPAQGTPIKVAAWPDSLYPGTFQRAAAGAFTADGHRSAVVVRGDALYLVWDPAVYVSHTPIAAGVVREVIAFPPAAAAPERDRMLLSTPSGVRLAAYDASGHYGDQIFLSSAAWADARNLCLSQTGDDLVLAATDANRTALLVTTATMTTLPSTTVVVPLAQTIASIAILDWDDDGVQEIALGLASEVRVYSLAGALLSTIPMAGTVQSVVRLPYDGRDHLAVAHAAQDGFPRIRIGNDAGFALPVQVDTSGFGPPPVLVTGLTTADLGQDGDADLVLSQNSSFGCVVLDTDPTAPWAQTYVGTPANQGNPALSACPVLCHDFEGNGRPDALWFFDSTPRWVLVRDLPYPAQYEGPDWIDAAWFEHDPGTGESRLTLHVPPEFLEGGFLLSLTVFHQPDPLGNTIPPLDPEPEPCTWEYNASTSMLVVTFHGLPVTAPHLFEGHDHYYFDLRVQTGDGDAKIGTAGWTMQSTQYPHPGAYGAYLLALPGGDNEPIYVKPPLRPDHIGVILTHKDPPPF